MAEAVQKKEKKTKLTPEQAHTRLIQKFYHKLPKPTAQLLHDRAKRIRLIGLEGTKAILAAGKYLTEVQQQLSRLKAKDAGGFFVRWLKLEGLGVSQATAYNWMRFYGMAEQYGTGIISRLGIKALSGASGKVLAQRLLKAGDLTPGQEERLARELKSEARGHKEATRERKKLMTKTVKAACREARTNLRTVITNRITDADAQARVVVSFCRELLAEFGLQKEWAVILKSQLPTE